VANRVPSLRLHKPSGQSVVTLQGRDYYLGPHGSLESKGAYDALIANYLARGRVAPHRVEVTDDPSEAMTVSEVMLAYLRHVEKYYVLPDGRPTSQVALVKLALKVVRRLHGDDPAASFGPLALLACQAEFVTQGLARSEVNRRVRLVRQFIRWAVSRELVPGSLAHALEAVEPLRNGRSEAHETDPVRPVPDDLVDRTIPLLPQVVAAMVQVQRLTGMRPQEIVQITTGDIDRSAAVWEFKPKHHKNACRGKHRVVMIGPRAQSILEPWLRPDAPELPLFSPLDRMADLSIERRAARKSRVTPSQRARKPNPERSRPPRDRYTTCSYRRAIQRACVAAGIDEWSPNQLRHSAATMIRTHVGIDAASTVLGHASPDTTLIYAERNLDLARETMARLG
jgi:integrase